MHLTSNMDEEQSEQATFHRIYPGVSFSFLVVNHSSLRGILQTFVCTKHKNGSPAGIQYTLLALVTQQDFGDLLHLKKKKTPHQQGLAD